MAKMFFLCFLALLGKTKAAGNSSYKSAEFEEIFVKTSSYNATKMITTYVRVLGECSIACLKNGSSQFLFDPTTETCLFGNGTESLVTSNSQLSTTKLWIDSLSPKTPRFFIVAGTNVGDLSLDATASPNLSPNSNWKVGSVWGRGRLVNNWFHICGGGSQANKNCTKRRMGDSTNIMDVDLPWESAIHNYGFSLAISEDRIWQTGGVGSTSGETTFWLNDGTWANGPSLPMYLVYHCIVQYDDFTSYLIGGANNNTNVTFQHLYKYDWKTTTWTKKASMIEKRAGHMCWLVEYPVGSGNKTILVAGGLSSFAPLSGPAYGAYNSTEVYNVDTNTWTKSLTLPTLRSEGTSLTIRNRYLWFGGRTGSTTVAGTNTVLEFNPVSGWMTSSMVLPSASSFPIVIPYNF